MSRMSVVAGASGSVRWLPKKKTIGPRMSAASNPPATMTTLVS